MKKKLLFLFSIAIAAILMSFATAQKSSKPEKAQTTEENGFSIPDNVKSVLDRSCLNCHGIDGKGKAKIKWNYEKMPSYSKSKLISKLSKIEDKINNAKMPPPRFLKKHPDNRLSQEEKETLTNWASGLATDLSK
ncbi:MAG: heme-binding domain-containing protein [Chlorobi bacterium]|nr:heme-binding domain-containing protein [Chlorobiota bacterium]